jgi:Arc/MetJ family transcription regulator
LAATHGGLTSHTSTSSNPSIVPHRNGALTDPPAGPGAQTVWQLIWHTWGMRTTLDIDDDLLAALLARYPGRSKTEAIEEGLRAHLAEDAVARLRRLAGTFEIEDVSGSVRARDRHL